MPATSSKCRLLPDRPRFPVVTRQRHSRLPEAVSWMNETGHSLGYFVAGSGRFRRVRCRLCRQACQGGKVAFGNTADPLPLFSADANRSRRLCHHSSVHNGKAKTDPRLSWRGGASASRRSHLCRVLKSSFRWEAIFFQESSRSPGELGPRAASWLVGDSAIRRFGDSAIRPKCAPSHRRRRAVSCCIAAGHGITRHAPPHGHFAALCRLLGPFGEPIVCRSCARSGWARR